MDLEQILNRINKNTVYKKIRELNVDHEYTIKQLELVKTSYGKFILVTTTDFKCFLPASWTNKFTPQDLKTLTEACPWLRLVYRGIEELRDGKSKHNIEIIKCR